MPVTIPADGAWPSYRSQAASAFSSRNAEPGSTSRSMRSRAGQLAARAMALDRRLAAARRDERRSVAELGDELRPCALRGARTSRRGRRGRRGRSCGLQRDEDRARCHLVADADVDRADGCRRTGAVTTCSIFIASSTTSGWCDATASPASTRTSITFPGIGAVMRPSPPAPALPRAGGLVDVQRREGRGRREVEPPRAVPRARRGLERRGRERRIPRQEVGRDVASRGTRGARRASGGRAGSSSPPRRSSRRAPRRAARAPRRGRRRGRSASRSSAS